MGFCWTAQVAAIVETQDAGAGAREDLGQGLAEKPEQQYVAMRSFAT